MGSWLGNSRPLLVYGDNYHDFKGCKLVYKGQWTNKWNPQTLKINKTSNTFSYKNNKGEEKVIEFQNLKDMRDRFRKPTDADVAFVASKAPKRDTAGKPVFFTKRTGFVLVNPTKHADKGGKLIYFYLPKGQRSLAMAFISGTADLRDAPRSNVMIKRPFDGIRTSATPRKRALIVSLGYPGTTHALRGSKGCEPLMEGFVQGQGFQDHNIQCLNDFLGPRERAMLRGCPDCDGNGEDEITRVKCATCNGYGQVQPRGVRRSDLENSLQWLTKDAINGDVLFFYFSGHGGLVYDENYLVLANDERLTATDLKEKLTKDLPSGVTVIVVLDCCCSGEMMKVKYKLDNTLNRGHDKWNEIFEYDDRSDNEPAIVAFTACAKKTWSFDDDVSVFSREFVKVAGNQTGEVWDVFLRLKNVCRKNRYDYWKRARCTNCETLVAPDKLDAEQCSSCGNGGKWYKVKYHIARPMRFGTDVNICFKDCLTCNGSKSCSTCNGKGGSYWKPCPTCKGSKHCVTCKGSGHRTGAGFGIRPFIPFIECSSPLSPQGQGHQMKSSVAKTKGRGKERARMSPRCETNARSLNLKKLNMRQLFDGICDAKGDIKECYTERRPVTDPFLVGVRKNFRKTGKVGSRSTA